MGASYLEIELSGRDHSKEIDRLSENEQIDRMGARKQNFDQNDSDYLSKRARNNEAVKRSREKARGKAKETTERVNKLKAENEMLEDRIKLLSKELTFLKDIFLTHAGSSRGLCLDDLDVKALLREDDDNENEDSNDKDDDDDSSEMNQPNSTVSDN